MNNQIEIDEKSKTRRKDLRFTGIVLIIYTICCILFGVWTFLSFREDRELQKANATATEAAFATLEAKITTTAISRNADHDQFEFIEPFDAASARWYVGRYDSRSAIANISIKDGVYIWDISDNKGNTLGTDFYLDYKLRNFDVYIDTKFVNSPTNGVVCSGLSFRRPSENWDDGGYIFTACNNSDYHVFYFGKNGWRTIATNHEDIIHPTDWNRIEINARDEYFSFFINNKLVFEMTDDLLAEGRIGTFIHFDGGNSAEIWFDNFGYQSR